MHGVAAQTHDVPDNFRHGLVMFCGNFLIQFHSGKECSRKGGVFADQGSIGPLSDSEQCFSHSWDIRALLARAIYCYIFSETEREKV